jgi:hypothetical protein
VALERRRDSLARWGEIHAAVMDCPPVRPNSRTTSALAHGTTSVDAALEFTAARSPTSSSTCKLDSAAESRLVCAQVNWSLGLTNHLI